MAILKVPAEVIAQMKHKKVAADEPKPKRKRVSKKSTPDPVAPEPTPDTTPEPSEAPAKAKKPRAKKAKVEAPAEPAEAAAKVQVEAPAEAPAEPAPKKAKKPLTEKQLAAAEKRRLAREEQKNAVNKVKELEAKLKKRAKKDDEIPKVMPKWFKEAVKVAKKNETDESNKAVIDQIAVEKWENASARKKLENKENNHQQRMFNMIFGR